LKACTQGERPPFFPMLDLYLRYTKNESRFEVGEAEFVKKDRFQEKKMSALSCGGIGETLGG
jgi:hypothetical protein